MPRAKKKPADAAAVAPEPTVAPLPVPTSNPDVGLAGPSNPHNLTVVYATMKITEFSTTSPHGPLGPEDIVLMMNWEKESVYQARMMAANPGSKLEHWAYGDVYHCLDTDKEKVRCWNNANNRPFDPDWCEGLIHTVLFGQWAGPLMMPGETVNGETVRISRYGRMLSGQHQCTACKIADEMLQKARETLGVEHADEKYPAWKGRPHCVIETIVITGMSEDERILRTVDYVKPRTVSDMLFTMELFRNNSPNERKEMTRVLAGGIDTLWNRTDTKGYKTHPEIVAFLERHKSLLKCVEHLFLVNSASKPTVAPSEDGAPPEPATPARGISRLRLSPGQCSALAFIMASSGPRTDGDQYRNDVPPSEKGLDWSQWDLAMAFWKEITYSEAFKPVRTALTQLVDSDMANDNNQGLGGRIGEKLAILSNAWERYKDHPLTAGRPFTEADLEPDGILSLSYSNLDSKGNRLPDGQIKLIDTADFLGIDCPVSLGQSRASAAGTPMSPPPTPAEIEAATKAALARRAAAAAP